jgi:hypothetical protein
VTTFGPPGPAWGEGPVQQPGHESSEQLESRNSDEHVPEFLELGGGIRLYVKPDWFHTAMHHPATTAAVEDRCEALAQEANSLAVEEGAVYEYAVSNNPNNIRARGRVRPANVKAVLDDDKNSTLLKALATVGSDPVPASAGEGAGLAEGEPDRESLPEGAPPEPPGPADASDAEIE